MTVDLQQEAHEKLATQDPVAPTERRIHRPAATQFIRRGVRRVKPVPLFSVSHHLFFKYIYLHARSLATCSLIGQIKRRHFFFISIVARH